MPSRGVLARVGAGGVESFEAIVSMLSISFFFSHSALTRPLRLSLSYFFIFRPQRIPGSPSNVSASPVSMTTRSNEVRGAPPPSPKMLSTCGTLGSDGKDGGLGDTVRPAVLGLPQERCILTIWQGVSCGARLRCAWRRRADSASRLFLG